MTFIWPWMLMSLIVVPLFVWVYLRMQRRYAAETGGLGGLSFVQDESGKKLGRRRHAAPIVFILGLSVLLFGFARPEVYADLPRIEGTVILAFDVSNSMIAEDLEPNRMEAAKMAAAAFVESQPATIQLGVVAFSSGGLVVQTPTYDKEEVLATIERLQPQGETSLGQGLFSSLNAAAGEPIGIDPEKLTEQLSEVDIGSYSSTVVLLLTDGENNASPDPLAIAQLAANAGVRVYPVGIGSEDGAVIEADGFQVVTRLNREMLEQIAGLTNGTVYYAKDEADLQEIYKSVDLQLTVRGDKLEVTALFAALGLLLFMVSGFITLFW
ncbi:MAG TPA: VWA domain-containing protein, partial [Anaerolineales bacterium]|nr:VWA domain-containing protein [Anaerolineales bacterium]